MKISRIKRVKRPWLLEKMYFWFLAGALAGFVLGCVGGYMISHKQFHFWKANEIMSEMKPEVDALKELLSGTMDRVDKITLEMKQYYEGTEKAKLWNRLTVSWPVPKGLADEE